ncbi:MAG: hypothetical protein GX673_10605 [Gammaproteobacteria bacterium]|nr:hypothetical protein [Gammaproteobacteria bacterium]
MSKKIPEHLEVWGTKEGQDLMRSMLNGGPLTEQDNKTAEHFRALNKKSRMSDKQQELKEWLQEASPNPAPEQLELLDER